MNSLARNIRYLFLLFSLSLAFFPGCKIIQRVTDPVTGVIKRGSCISIDLPPITLTPERTAAERQLLGDNKEIEKNGWLVASSMGVKAERAVLRETSKELELIRRLYRERAVIEFYNDLLNEYRQNGVLGEGYDGMVQVVPGKISGRRGKYNARSEILKAQSILREVNRSRTWIYEYHRGLEAKKKNPDLKTVLHKYRKVYWREAPRGIWIQNEKKGWERR